MKDKDAVSVPENKKKMKKKRVGLTVLGGGLELDSGGGVAKEDIGDERECVRGRSRGYRGGLGIGIKSRIGRECK